MRKIILIITIINIIYEIFQVTSVPFFIPDFNLLICKLDNFTFKVLYWVILCQYYNKTKWNYNTFTVSCRKFKMVSLASSTIKNIVLLLFTSSPRLRFPVILICFIAFGLASSACSYLNLLLSFYNNFLNNYSPANN